MFNKTLSDTSPEVQYTQLQTSLDVKQLQKL